VTEPSRPLAWGLLAAWFAALAYWSWGKWTDPLIDFGFELYVPWRLSEGDVLYRDIAYRNGPLSPYWNALLFASFGHSLRTLVIANLTQLVAITALMFGLIERALSRLGALVGCAVFLATCAFSQYGNVGNYNFVTPYQHGQTHGLLLGLGLLALLARPGGSPVRWAAAGGLLGALGLTKAELFVPGLAAATCAAALEIRSGNDSARRCILALLAAAGAAILAAGLALGLALPADAALRGMLGNWPYIGGALLDDTFYARTAGFEEPGRQILAMLGATAALAAAALALAGIDRAAPGREPQGGWPLVLAPAVGVAVGIFAGLPWTDLALVLPLAMVAAIALWLPASLRQDTGARSGILLAVFALALLGKLGLHPRVQHYGFALAAPALALAVAGFVSAWKTTAARSVAVALAAAFASSLLAHADAIYSWKTFDLASGGDRIRVAAPERSPRGPTVERALRDLEAIMPDTASLLVMPEGVSLNYWLRRTNPTPYSLFLPTELAAHGGADAMLERMRETPPDYIALVHRGHREFGTEPFLEDPRYGAAFRSWLDYEYTAFRQIGAAPFRGHAFGIVILRRTATTDPVSS